jgi:hypothetical protein
VGGGRFLAAGRPVAGGAMTSAVLLHVTSDLPGRFRRVGLRVAEHANAITVWCPVCTERQTYRRSSDGWQGASFAHDDGCAHFRATQARLGIG